MNFECVHRLLFVFCPEVHLHHLFFLLVGCHGVIHPHSRCHFIGLEHIRFRGTERVKYWNPCLRGQPATVGEDALLCMQLPLDVSSPLVLETEAVKHDSRWLVAEDGIGKWSLILLVSKQGLIKSVQLLGKELLDCKLKLLINQGPL